MARRIEICVPLDYADDVRECLESPDKCDLADDSSKPGFIVELEGKDTAVFIITVPSGAISGYLEILKNEGFGIAVGTVALIGIDALKPRFNKGLIIPRRPGLMTPITNADGTPTKSSLQGFRDFQKARLTTEEIYNTVFNLANMTMNTWVFLIGASVMAAGGLASNASVFVVAAMLVSPIMGPILGITFGYRVADWQLFKTGVINETKMAVVAFAVGAFCGMLIGSVGNTYNWPTSAMQTDGQSFALIISVLVSAAAGAVLAVTITSGGINSLVGTAISAGLLPPLVNAGMLIAYAGIYSPPSERFKFYEMGAYALVFYLSHVITIIVVANIVFWLKEIDPRFSTSEDASYNDLPSVKNLMKRRAEGKNFFLDNLQHELVAMKEDIEDFGSDLRSNIVGGVKGIGAVVTGQTGDRDREREKEKERKKEKEERRAARRSEVEDLEGAFGESGGGLSALKERRRGVPLDEGQLPGRPTRGDSRVSASQRSRSRTSSAGVSMGGAVGYSGEEPHHQTSSETDQHSTTRTGNRGEGGRSSGSGGNKDATTHNPMLDLI